MPPEVSRCFLQEGDAQGAPPAEKEKRRNKSVLVGLSAFSGVTRRQEKGGALRRDRVRGPAAGLTTSRQEALVCGPRAVPPGVTLFPANQCRFCALKVTKQRGGQARRERAGVDYVLCLRRAYSDPINLSDSSRRRFMIWH